MKYIHPHSESRIIDNAVLTVSASGLSNKFIALEAEKGMPNEATYISSPSEYTFNFGEPNYNKYGQSGLNAIQWLRAGGGLWVIRVVPDDETFAGLSVGIGYRADTEYANDETEFKRLERSENQIKVWNGYSPDGDGHMTMVKGKASGNSAVFPLYYAAKLVDGKYEPIVAMGMMTQDEIMLENLKQPEGKKYKAIAQRAVPMVSNDSVGIRFEATVDNFNYSFVEGGYKKFYYILNKRRIDDAASTQSGAFKWFNESSVVATEIGYTNAPNGKAKAIKMAEIPATEAQDPTTFDAVKIVVEANFVGSAPAGSEANVDTIPELIAAYVTASDNKSYAAIGDMERFTATKLLCHLDEASPRFSEANGYHTSDLIALLKAEVAALGDNCLKQIYSGASKTEWRDSFEVYYFDPQNYTSLAMVGSVRPISEREMKTIGDVLKVSQPALTIQEFNDWMFANSLDNKLIALGAQFGISSADIPLATGDGDVLVTSTGEAISAEGSSNSATFTATNPEVLVSVPSTGSYKTEKLFFVSDNNGNQLYSKTITSPEAASFNLAKAPNRFANIFPNQELKPAQYVYGSSDYASKPILEYTMTAKVKSLSDVKVEGFGVTDETSTNIIAAELLSFFNKIGGRNFMKFAKTEDGETVVTFDLEGGYLSYAEYQNLDPSYKNLFELATGTDRRGRYVLKASVPRTVLPSDFGNNGPYKDLIGDYGLYVTHNDDRDLNVAGSEEWRITLIINTFVTDMLTAVNNTIEGNGGSNEEIAEVHFAPSSKMAYIDGDSFWGVKLSYCATAFDTSFFTAMALGEDPEHAVALKGKNTGEYAFYPELFVETYYNGVGSKGNFEPNPDYEHAVYNAIGFVATPFTVFDIQGDEYEADDPEVVEQRANSTKGRVVGSTLDKITTVTETELRAPSASYVEFLRFLPKGSGKWYNRLSVSLAYDDSFDRTYTEWSMFLLTISEKVDGGEISRETFKVSLDPDAVSASKESLFIEDVVNRFSKYLTCVVNYDNLTNFVDAKLGIRTADNKPVEDEDGNEIVVPVDAVVKLIYNQIDLDTFNERVFGEAYEDSALAQYKIENLMSAIGYDSNLCHLDTTIYAEDGVTRIYKEPFVSLYLFQTLSGSNSLYLNGGTYGRGWGYEHTNDEGELVTNSTLEQALVKAYNGTTDSIITNVNLCVFDMVMDCNYPVMVKTAMNDLSSVIRQDCVTILDQGISTANAQQAIDMRKNEMNYDTFYTSIFTQHLEITDEWSGKPVKVTPTFFLASKIPMNDTAYSPAVNFVGPNRGVISGFNSVSWIPTEPEKDQLYRNQINYIERDNIATLFATELTTQTKNTPLTLIHPVRTLLRLRRSMVAASRSYRSEFATSDVYGLLQTELNEIAASYVMAGGYEYITPVINTSDYDRQQRICRVDVDVAFTDIIERFAFNFIVNRV
jgi:hypothetical protein